LVVDLPVGRKLQDHYGFTFNFKLSSETNNVLENLTRQDYRRYLKGKYSEVLGSVSHEAMILTTPKARVLGEADWPDIFFIKPVVNTTSTIFLGRQEYNKDTYGNVELNTSAYKLGERDIAKLAVIHVNYLMSNLDQTRLLEGKNSTNSM